MFKKSYYLKRDFQSMKTAMSYSIQYILVHLSRSTITYIFVTQNKCRMY